MKTSEALLAIIRCMGITDELDDVLKKTAEQILIKVNDDIIAWMPLPEPYKGGDDE